MQTARDWLAERGLAIAGARGKFSNAAHKALEKAAAEGVTWSDWPKDKTSTRPVVKVEKTTTVRASAHTGDYPFLTNDELNYPEENYRAVERDSGKKRSMREVCRTCGVSLVGHACDNPYIVATNGAGSVAVKVVGK